MDIDKSATDVVDATSPEIPQEVQEVIEVQTDLSNDPKKWYVIHVKTGYEGRVKSALEQRIKSLGVE
ncbi:MAG: transcription termination/antitermination protein NusG, partial [Microgenomates group bacterium]